MHIIYYLQTLLARGTGSARSVLLLAMGLLHLGCAVSVYGYVRANFLFASNGSIDDFYNGVRAAVSLKPEIQITGGDGSTSTPWTLGEN